ncbi:ferritin-like domain-containing protein [Paractinoplanes atraurantiacus]|uniref:DUF2202 domain-containing protein n=1 Tax=Paractinoplanes atraurantiacus TaxID=1036182 RepID=A0A285JJ06_9ACTN|nr:DUF2202 domain-containing protein [Actinoplanes atraurantiacus]SNY59366.1 hypothetical protein SAMN05421748_120121 [Actinoplanes atraurantiacus]
MRTITRRAAILVAAGTLGLGGLAVAAPALAGDGPFGPGPSSTATADPGARGGVGSGYGMGFGYGMGPANGACRRLPVGARQGTLSTAQKATLASMAQEEKLAHDLYAAFAARYDAVVFDHIAHAESRHQAAVRTLLQRYGITDPTANQPAGTFADETMQATYDRLLAQGRPSQAAAMAVGQQVERDDIAALKAAADGLTAPDVKQVYTDLLVASQRHLTAFTRWAAR